MKGFRDGLVIHIMIINNHGSQALIMSLELFFQQLIIIETRAITVGIYYLFKTQLLLYYKRISCLHELPKRQVFLICKNQLLLKLQIIYK